MSKLHRIELLVLLPFFSRFAIDPATNVFSPMDQSVNSFGNSELSQLDIEKLNCLYKCDPLCGGFIAGRNVIKYGYWFIFHLGTEGSVEVSGAKSCRWMFGVIDGSAVQINFEKFDVSYKRHWYAIWSK